MNQNVRLAGSWEKSVLNLLHIPLRVCPMGSIVFEVALVVLY